MEVSVKPLGESAVEKKESGAESTAASSEKRSGGGVSRKASAKRHRHSGVHPGTSPLSPCHASPAAALAAICAAASAGDDDGADDNATPASVVTGADGQLLLHWTVPAGASGGQTLLVSVRRPNEFIDLTVPDGALAGDLLLARTSLGQPVHVAVPESASAGERLLLSVALPPQGLHVTIPASAQPGRAISVPLPSPLSEAADAADGEATQIRNLKRRSGSGGGADRSKRRMMDAASSEAQLEMLLAPIELAVPPGGAPELALRQLHQMPEAVEVWLMYDAMHTRLELPQLTLSQFEQLMCVSMDPDKMMDGVKGGGAPMGGGHRWGRAPHRRPLLSRRWPL